MQASMILTDTKENINKCHNNTMNIMIDQINREATSQLDSDRRAENGQYMTPSAIAIFMASLFTNIRKARLLDAGAGVGSLTLAFIDRALLEKTSASVDTWEIDDILRQYLKNMLEYCKQQAQEKITFNIHSTDFIEDASIALQLGNMKRYTHAILNPPYKKIKSNSKHRDLLSKVGIETVNMYSAFVALSILLLEKGGEIVAIIPRSFCNGAYYRSFRRLILKKCSIEHIHLFESRTKAFRDDEVLQENVIIHLVKEGQQNRVTVSTSHDSHFKDYQQNEFDIAAIVKPDDDAQFIHIPTNYDQTIAPKLCTQSLQEIGLEVCTGPVVDFRVKNYWHKKPSQDTVPLLYPHHFSDGFLTWPKSHKKPNALQINYEVKKLLLPRGHYVLVKRFSSKEERRRIVAYYLSNDALDSHYIGFENHFNVFHVNRHGIDKCLAQGLTLFLNSTMIDLHFRVFSGHTQVNATDLRKMRYPSREILINLGRHYRHSNDQAAIDNLIKGM